MRASEEGILLRGAPANGLRIGALCASMTGVYDWCKENSYFMLGPSWINRFWATAAATIVGVLASLPFDAVRTRMHTMRPLPNGRLPYTSCFDCLKKILYFESSHAYSSNMGGSLYAGAQAYGVRLFAVCYLTQFLLDYYHAGNNVSEFWQPARFHYQSGIDYDIHEPFTDGFNKLMVTRWSSSMAAAPFHPDGKSDIKIV